MQLACDSKAMVSQYNVNIFFYDYFYQNACDAHSGKKCVMIGLVAKKCCLVLHLYIDCSFLH